MGAPQQRHNWVRVPHLTVPNPVRGARFLADSSMIAWPRPIPSSGPDGERSGGLLPRVVVQGGPAAVRVEQSDPVGLGETAPYAVGLLDGEGVTAAGLDDRAGRADGLGVGFPDLPGGTAGSFGVEEQRAVDVTAGALELPFPQFDDRDG